MARFGFTVTKTVTFRGVAQHFSNTYYYQRALWTPADSQLSGMIDEIVATEKKLHSIDVQFVRGQCWSADGTPGQNVMRVQKVLTGTGLGLAVTTMDRERAILIRWPAGKDVRGKPVYLRKWFHVSGDLQSASAFVTNALLQNTAGMADSQRTTIAGIAEELRELGISETYQLCAASGRENQGSAQCHKYLEHHQLGDEWR
jgi:hypothetical protein